MLLPLLLAFLQPPLSPRQPAFAPDGRLAVAIDGDLWLRRAPDAPLVPLTRGAAWDRDPAWTPDGRALVFASDRAGSYDLWRVALGDDGAAGEPERLTQAPGWEVEPSVAPDGRIVFTRGSGGAARLWVREPDGTERRLATVERTERGARVAPDGATVAFVAVRGDTARLVVRTLASGAEVVVDADRGAERVAWAPDGQRVAFSARTGTWVAPPDGRYANLASTRRGDVAWSPDGATLLIATWREPAPVGYNGDPDRGVDRAVEEWPADSAGRLVAVAAPAPPDAGLAETRLAADRTRAERNADAFDRVWERSARAYFAGPEAAARRAAWDRVKARHRPAAVAAASDDALQRAIHGMLRERPPLREPARGRAAVSSAHPVATEAGLEVLRAGGNVVDAAVAVSFALGVVEPDASGVGGYGQMLVHLAGMPSPALVDFMSRVPEAATLSNTALLRNGRYPPDGPVLTMVPGTVAGMRLAWERYGSKRVPWAALLAPAIRAARDGYVVSDGLATTLATERDAFAKYAGSRALFFRDGRPLVAGDTVRNPDLAWVLEQVADKGADGFYAGDVAAKWVAALREGGSVMTVRDLGRYFAQVTAPVSGTYRGHTIYSSAPPVAGGAQLVARLNLLEQYPSPRPYPDDAATLHAALTAWFLVPSTQRRIADPAFWPVQVEPIVHKDTARARWRCFDPARALRPADVRGDSLPCLAPRGATGSEPAAADAASSSGAALPAAATSGATAPANGVGPASVGAPALAELRPCEADASVPHAAEASACRAAGTTAFTVADADGNVVAVTQTLGTWGGNFHVAPGLGFLANDKLTSYGTDSTQYGARLPFSRHGSTLAPTIAFRNGRPVFAVGAAGNAWITSAVYQALLGALDYGLDPQRALELPRFLPGGGGPFGGAPGGGYTIQLEDGFAPEVVARLRALGYGLSFVSARGELREGYGAAVSLDGRTVTAGADPRRSGAAGAIP
jgi:gamma-glutamyltranspeptidase/Tol biopolymer transport system component